MLFSELYSAYYNTVAKIITKAFDPSVTEKDLQKLVSEQAFSESVLTIIPALKSGRWPLLNEDLSPVLRHKPEMPLTLLEKRWLKSIFEDPRIKLFGIEPPHLEGIAPLFTQEDYRIYDKYSDGDPFEDESYIKNFRIILSAIKENRAVNISMTNRHGKELKVRFIPKGFEYSVKDDKLRVIATGCKYSLFNMGRITSCDYCTEGLIWRKKPKKEEKKTLKLLITDRRNALERVMLHFAHFEKQAEKTGENKYLLKLWYYENDETEIVIRVLSFGPYVKVIEPESFVNLIKERLISQKSCELK